MRLIVTADARALGIHHPAAVIVANASVSVAESEDLTTQCRAAEARLRDHRDEILARPEVRGFREIFQRMGYPDQLPAGEKTLRAFGENGVKRINNVVDAYNIASALSGSGLGMHDASLIGEDIVIDRARGGEAIVPLGRSKRVTIPAGDLVYGTRRGAIAWLGKKDVDSDEYKVTARTTELLLVALGNRRTGPEYNLRACQISFDLIRLTCPAATMVVLPAAFADQDAR